MLVFVYLMLFDCNKLVAHVFVDMKNTFKLKNLFDDFIVIGLKQRQYVYSCQVEKFILDDRLLELVILL